MDLDNKVPQTNSLLRWGGFALCGLVAFVWPMLFAGRGHFAVDQSMTLDAAYRMTLGQVPYVDYGLAHGFLTVTYQWLLFELFGVGYDTFVLGGALVNVAGTVLAMITVGHLVPKRPWLVVISGIITAFWFQAPFGTPWSEQTTFTFAFVGLNLAWAARRPDGIWQQRRTLCLLLAGAASGLSFFGKQNAAVLFFVVYFVIFAWVERGGVKHVVRSCTLIGAGFLAAGGAMLALLAAFSSVGGFFHSVFAVPAGKLIPRLMATFPDILFCPVFGRGRADVVIACFIVTVVFAAFLWLARSSRDADPNTRKSYELAVLGLALLLFQNLFALVTLNDAANLRPFIGVLVALTGVVLAPLWGLVSARDWGRAPHSALQLAVLAALVVFFVGRGMHISALRKVHDVFDDSQFIHHVEAPGWERLIWATPMRINGTEYGIEDFNALIAYLKKDGRNFFVCPDHSLLYAIVGRPPPQPVVTFWSGITYPSDYDRELDASIVEALQKNRVELVVMESTPFDAFKRFDLHNDFPLLEAYIDGSFRPTVRFGPFAVLEKK